MATKRIPVRQLREILRLRLHAKLSMRQIRDSLRLSLGVKQKAVSKAEALELDWEAIEKLHDSHLAAKIYPHADTAKSSHKERGALFMLTPVFMTRFTSKISFC